LLRKTLGTLGKRHYKICFDSEHIAEAFAELIRNNAVKYKFHNPGALRSKNDALSQNVLQIAALK
jgi:pantothenate kinase